MIDLVGDQIRSDQVVEVTRLTAMGSWGEGERGEGQGMEKIDEMI